MRRALLGALAGLIVLAVASGVAVATVALLNANHGLALIAMWVILAMAGGAWIATGR